MSYANGTQFYDLPQTVGSDKRDWFDTNAAFAAIDAALHAAVAGQAADAEAISTINGKLTTDEAAIAALQTASTSQAASIAALQTTVTTQGNQIADVRQDAEDMITANNEGAAATSTKAYGIGERFIYNDVLYKATAPIAIGDTIVPNTNCKATNVDTEIKELEDSIPEDKVGNLADLTTTDKTSAVAAINEVKSNLTNYIEDQPRELYGQVHCPSTGYVAITDVNIDSTKPFTIIATAYFLNGATKCNAQVYSTTLDANNVITNITFGGFDMTGNPLECDIFYHVIGSAPTV